MTGGHEAGPLREAKTKASVDNSEDDYRATEPDVPVRPDRACIVTLEEDVVEESEQRLEDQEREDHNANDRVGVVQRVEVPRHPDADTEGGGV